MIEAMEAFTSRPKFKEEFPHFDVRAALPAPYLFWYHDRSPEAFEGLNALHRKYMLKLTGWIDENYGEMYLRVEKQLERRVVSYETIEFLFKPGDGIILDTKPEWEGIAPNAEIATSWPLSTTPKQLVDAAAENFWAKIKDKKKKFTWKWTLECWAYRYDGSFYRSDRYIEINMQADRMDEEVDIHKLNAYPLKYASEETRALLEKRGRTFWSCRERRLVSYEDRKGIYGVCFHSPGSNMC